MSVIAADLSHETAHDRFAVLRTRVPWKALSLGLAALFVVLIIPHYDETQRYWLFPIFDTLLGCATAVWFIAIAKDQRAGKRSLAATVFSWKPCVWLGTFSYSLYLINDPIIQVVMQYVYPAPPLVKVTVGFLVVVPMIVLLAYVFGRIFETPFVSTVRRQADEAVLAADAAKPTGARITA